MRTHPQRQEHRDPNTQAATRAGVLMQPAPQGGEPLPPPTQGDRGTMTGSLSEVFFHASAQLAGLPEPVQEQLLRIYRLAAGMDSLEKEAARLTFAAFVGSCATDVGSDLVVAPAEMIAAAGQIVTLIDGLSGVAASRLEG